jgi:hypothetical protein
MLPWFWCQGCSGLREVERLFALSLVGPDGAGRVDIMIDQFDDEQLSVWSLLMSVIGRRRRTGTCTSSSVQLLEARGERTSTGRPCPDIPKGDLPPPPRRNAEGLRLRGCARRGVHACDWAQASAFFALVTIDVPQVLPRARPMGQTHEISPGLTERRCE